MPSITKAQAQADLVKLYQAKTQFLLEGKSVSVQTSAGMRSVTRYSMDEIDRHIAHLERIVAAPEGSTRQGRHDFAVANFNHSGRE